MLRVDHIESTLHRRQEGSFTKILCCASKIDEMPRPRCLVLLMLAMALMLGFASNNQGGQNESTPPSLTQSEMAVSTEQPKQVLLVFGEDQRFPLVSTLSQSIRRTLDNESAAHVEYYTEYLDRALVDDKVYEKELISLWRKKYQNRKIDLIIVCIASAVDLLSRHKSELFPGTPAVFCVLLARELSQFIELAPDITGVWSASPFRPTLEVALRLHPDTMRVIVIYGSSDFDKDMLEMTKGDLADFEKQVEIVYLTDVTMTELQARLARLPEHSIVLYGAFAKDSAGLIFTGAEGISRIAPASSAPIYGFATTLIGSGLVGGSLMSIDELGARAGQLGARILSGERPQDITPTSVPNVVTFDWRQLRQWGIPEKNLPPGSTVLFRQQSFLEQYRWRVAAVVSLIIFEALLIAGLLVNRAQRRQAEKENAALAALADQEHRHLEEVMSNVPAIVWETRGEPGSENRRITFLNDYAEKMLGYSTAEWFSTPRFSSSIIPQEDRERVSLHTEKVLASGKESSIEFRWLAKDGRLLWAEGRLSPILDEKGRTIGVRGVTLDVTERKLAEEALRGNRMQLAGIIDSAMDAIVSVDEHHHIVLLNAAAEKMFGVTARETIGLPVERFIPERFREAHRRHVETLPKTNLNGRLVGSMNGLVGRRADGSEFPVEASMSETELNGRKFYTVMLRDITARKLAEQALVESAANYRSIFNAVNDAIFVLDIQTGHVVDVNHVMCEMYGVTQDEARTLGPEVLSSNEPPYTPEAALEWLRKASKGEPQVFEWHARDKSGRQFWVEVSLRKSVIGGKERVLAVVRDITFRKQADEALLESEERFRIMADTAPVMIWVSGPDKQCTYFNQQWLDFTGQEIERELGFGWTERVHPNDLDRYLGTLTASFDRHDPFTMEFRLRRADGQFRWLYNSGSPRFSSSGKFLGYIGSCIDITERKIAEQSLARLSGQLIRAREEECARIARELHDDLNQRIALVSVELDQLKHNPSASPGTLRKQIQDIMSQTAEISQEIHRMSYDLHPSKLIHLGLVATINSMCGELSKRQGLKIEFSYESLPATIPQDISLCLYRIVQECLNNVIRHSGAKEARIELRGTGEVIRLRVSDSGKGFDTQSPRIKKGLGLLSMRERLRLIGGAISIESRPNQGTRIDATVPLERTAQETEDLSTSEKAQAAEG